jgi:hypothetical protein
MSPGLAKGEDPARTDKGLWFVVGRVRVVFS